MTPRDAAASFAPSHPKAERAYTANGIPYFAPAWLLASRAMFVTNVPKMMLAMTSANVNPLAKRLAVMEKVAGFTLMATHRAANDHHGHVRSSGASGASCSSCTTPPPSFRLQRFVCFPSRCLGPLLSSSTIAVIAGGDAIDDDPQNTKPQLNRGLD